MIVWVGELWIGQCRVADRWRVWIGVELNGWSGFTMKSLFYAFDAGCTALFCAVLAHLRRS